MNPLYFIISFFILLFTFGAGMIFGASMAKRYMEEKK